MFTPSRMTVARMRRGLTKSALAEAVDVTMRSISAYEKGEMEPSPETLAQIADVLGFHVSFFERAAIERPPVSTASFRALASMTASRRNAAIAAGALAVELNEWIEKRFELPTADIPSFRGITPEAAAEAVRVHWQLGEKPIRNVVHLLEQHGVRVFSLAEECREVDAFSLWRGGKPFVFLNTQKSAERSRFDAAHELGHLALHRHGGPGSRGREAEREADEFASAFLMPRASVLAVAPRYPTLSMIVSLKKQWSVSAAALVYRLRSVALLTEWHYRTLMVDLSERGYRTNEPNPGERETSQVLQKVFTALRAQGMTRAALAQDLGVEPPDVDALVFGLAFVALRAAHQSERTATTPASMHLLAKRKYRSEPD